jgi:precorrin-4/cobalt-precorrin-4 C11-methyltransferase
MAPLSEMASVTIKENLTRTTLFVISPALNNLKSITKERSQLYSSHYNRLFKN